MASEMENSNKLLDETIKLLSDKKYSDKAYTKIIEFNFSAIPLLISNSSNINIFEGYKVYNPASSLLIDKPTVGLVSLYLIECIIMNNETPYLAPLIVTNEGTFKIKNKGLPKTNNKIINKAAVYYEEWWNSANDIDKSQIQKRSPLADTDLKWWGMREQSRGTTLN